MTYLETYSVKPIPSGAVSKDFVLKVSVPGSKSITNRALLLATLAKGKSLLSGALFSQDAVHFANCIKELGFETVTDEIHKTIAVTGLGGAVPKKEASLYVGSAGTAARFLAAYLGVCEGTYEMDSSEQMKKRPMEPLLKGLEALGCEVTFREKDYFFPFTLKGKGFGTHEISVNIDKSSQFLSALLIAGVLSDEDLTIHVEGSHGMSYIHITVAMMEQFGVQVRQTDERTFVIPAGQSYRAGDYSIEPDVSAACYFYSMCPLLNLPVLVYGVHKDSLQGDLALLYVFEQMGCGIEDTEEGILLTPPASGTFPGVDVDMSAFSDQAITLSALAPFATSPTTIRNIGHIRVQESDRLTGIATELTKQGVSCEEGADYLVIHPSAPKGGTVETYDDHRMAMGFSLLGLRSKGVMINNPSCCQKTFAEYFDVLDEITKLIEKERR